MSTSTYTLQRIRRTDPGAPPRRRRLVDWLRRGQLGSGYSRDWPSTADARAI